MLKNYIKVALRNLARYKLFSIINILGLGVSLTVGMLIILMLTDQKSYDQFHQQKDQIYRVISKRSNGGNQSATSPLPFAQEVRNQYQGVEKVTQLVLSLGGDIQYESFVADAVGLYADHEFFNVFSFDLSQGNPQTALKDPYSMVLTREVADKLFPDGNALGKTVTFKERGMDIYKFGMMLDKIKDYGSFTITGIMAEPAGKSHLKFEILVSASTMNSLKQADIEQFPLNDWGNSFRGYNYLLLQPEADPQNLEQQLNAMASRVKPENDEFQMVYELQPLTEITPGKLLNNMSSVSLPLILYYILMGLAIMVILLAGLNYTSLSIARAVSRAREIGIRKVNGAGSKQIFFQFLGESILVALLSLLIGYLLLLIIRPSFMNLWINQYLNFDLSERPMVFFWFFIFACFAGVISGLFPGVYLSRFRPAEVIKNMKKGTSSGRRKKGILSFLVVFQFSISLIFMITTLVIYRQVKHFHQADFGYNQNNIYNVDLQGQDYNQVYQRFNQVSQVMEMSGTEYIPGTGFMNQIDLYPDTAAEKYTARKFAIDQHFFDNLEINLVAGKGFSGDALDKNYLVVNKQAAEELGYENPVDIIGAALYNAQKDAQYTIIGVVDNFKIEMIFQKQEAAIFNYNPDELKFLNIRYADGQLKNLHDQLAMAWHEFDPVHPLKANLFSDTLHSSSALFSDVAKIIGYIAFLAVVISCFGLLGMVTLDTERRTREIGVRKVLGADTVQLLMLLLRGFFKVFAIMLLIALPLAYLLNQKGLETIANRITLSWDIFVLGIGMLLLLAVVTIGTQTLKAALTNPADVLKND